jgi:alpha-beta hydrolase superfamily lysophospholipase
MAEGTRDPAALAAAVIDLAGQGRFTDVEAMFAPRLREAVSAEAVAAAWQAEVRPLGPVRGLGAPTIEPIEDGLTRVTLPVAFDKGALLLLIAADPDGRLHGLRLAPGGAAEWETPEYAAPSRLTERDVVVGEGPLAVPGTLTLPRGRGPFPGAVLLAGGGPFDRDGAAGPLKPLKDLAWGLAAQGIATIRFDKVNFAHPAAVAASPGFTMTDEYVPHALAALRLLRGEISVSERLFVIGHSMGGKVAPRVALADPSVAGLVLLAADAEPMQRSAVRVVRYLASLHLVPAEVVEMMERQADLVESPNLAPTTPGAELPLGYPGAYWLDQRDYDPVAAAAALAVPMLILQGGRDYQVTVDDDLARWRAGVGERDGVRVRVFERDNHMFAPGDGPSTPAEYAVPAHVDAEVVAEVAAWIGGDGPGEGRGARLFSGLRRRG